MIRISLAIVFLFGFLASNAQKKAPAVTDTSLMAKIVFQESLHDMGTIKREGQATFIFTFTNEGKSPLVLANVKPRCSCTVAEWSKVPVKPGQPGEITIKYTPDHRGDFLQDFSVTSNALNSPVEIHIKGVIR
jgi:hypothetical protein